MKVKLEDVCEKDSSNLKLSDVDGMDGDYPIYGAAGYIGNVGFYHQERPYVAVVKDGAGIGRTTIHPAKSSVIGTMQYLLPKGNILPEYLYYVVSYMHLEKYYTGTSIPHIYFKDYKNEKFNLDLIQNQKRIVDILGKCEMIIRLRTRELELLDNLIKARFVEMFGDIILNDKGWKTDTWSNALKIVNGKNQKAVESDDGEYLICGSGGAMGRATEYLTNENSVIIGRKGSINKPLLMREKYWNVDTAFGIEPNRKYINVDYLYMFCVFFNFEQLNKAVTIPSLTKADLLNIEMPIPNILLQEQFADFVHQVDKSKVAVQKALDETKLLFDSLMQKYFG